MNDQTAYDYFERLNWTVETLGDLQYQLGEALDDSDEVTPAGIALFNKVYRIMADNRELMYPDFRFGVDTHWSFDLIHLVRPDVAVDRWHAVLSSGQIWGEGTPIGTWEHQVFGGIKYRGVHQYLPSPPVGDRAVFHGFVAPIHDPKIVNLLKTLLPAGWVGQLLAAGIVREA